MKINLLIVEDEQIIRNQLKNLPWSDFGITNVFYAENAAEAWKIAAKNHPDILITDIRMPGESGLDFSKKLKSRLPQIKIILLTAYDLFEYTKSAIQIGVFEYLLKPIDYEQIEQTVKSAIESVKTDKENTQDINIAKLFKENRFWLKNYFLSSLKKSSSLEEICHIFSIPKEETVYSTIYVKIHTKTTQTYSDFSKIVLLLTSEDYYIIPFYEYDSFVIFVKLKTAMNSYGALTTFSEIAENIKKFLEFNYTQDELQYSITIGDIVTSLSDLAYSYETAENSLDYRFYIGNNQIIYSKDMEPSTDIVKYKEHIRNATLALKTGNLPLTLDHIDMLFSKFKENNIDINTIQRICLEFIVNISTAMIQLNQDPNFIFDKLDVWNFLKTKTTLNDIQDTLKNTVDVLISKINNTRHSQKKDLINNVLKYVNDNYTSPLSLESVASKFYISPCYLSTLFRQETKINFKAYIKTLKMDKAKELLSTTNMTIQEISEFLGYRTASYFGEIFHAETGVLPSEYRINSKI